MDPKKRVIVLVTVAIVLAIVAISMQFFGSDEVPTTFVNSNVIKQPVDGGKVKMGIGEFEGVEDKLAGGSP